MTTKRSDTDFDLCRFAYSDGRYCGNPIAPGYDGLCRSHGEREKFMKRKPVEHNDFIFLEPFKNDPPSEEDVHSGIAAIFRALAADRISTRRAATLGYLGQLLLLKQHATKENREQLQNLTRILVKTLDVTYNKNYRSPVPDVHEAAQQPAVTPKAKAS